jgi:hypothetical protein
MDNHVRAWMRSTPRRFALRRFVAVLGTLVVAGCAATETLNIGQNYVLSAASGKGLVIGSIIDRSPYPNYSILLYRRVGATEESYFQTGGSELIVVELPIGDYEVESWRVSVEDGSIIPTRRFTVAFRVTAGKAVYVGSYEFHLDIEAVGSGQFASSIANSKWVVDVTCTDQSERDMRAFALRHPALSSVELATVELKQCRENLGDGSRYYAQRLRLGAALGI